MLLSNIFHPDIIKTPLESTDKEELFEEMVELYVMHDSSIERSTILNALWNRENKLSTAIKDGIALPHARIVGLKEPKGIIGISKNGIHYDSGNKPLVYFVFMLLSTVGDADLHLQILSGINVLLGNPEFLNTLLNQTSPEAIYRIIGEYEAAMLEI